MSDAAATPLSRISPFRAGLATLLVGAVLLGVGILRTTAATPQPSCPPGTVLVAKFEYEGRRYKFEKPKGNANVVTLANANADGGSWSSTRPISHILVKGGPGHKVIDYDPPTTQGSFDNKGLKNPGGKRPDISNIQFCGPKHPPATTTTSTTSSTTASTTTTSTTTSTSTTTTEPTTTTTESTTTTSEPEDTTTTTSTTTTSTTSTTEPEEETTTTTSTSTTSTTEPEEETTTTEPGGSSTTSEPEDTSTTEPPGEVLGDVVVNTTIVANDAEVAAAGGSRTLPRTGAPSVPLVVVGIALIVLGGTVSLVTRRRGATS